MSTSWPLITPIIVAAGVPQVAVYAPMLGGQIDNPATAAEQGIAVAEQLTVIVGGIATVVAIGGSYVFPIDNADVVYVKAASPGHRFTGFVTQPDADFQPSFQACDGRPSPCKFPSLFTLY